MTYKRLHIAACIIALLTSAVKANNPYPVDIKYDNPKIENIADLTHCFHNGQAVFDELYIYGRIWQERQDTNLYKLPNINLQQLRELTNIQELNTDRVLQDPRNRNLLWYVEPQVRCTLAVEQYLTELHYKPVIDKFGANTCQAQYTRTLLTDSTKYIYADYAQPLPDSTTQIIARANECTCRWTTSQNFTIREYFDYDYIATTYRWIGQPDTLLDTVGCVVMRINNQLFNIHSEGPNHIPMGELHYIDGATEWISPTDTAFIASAPGGGIHTARMEWATDTIHDTYYWNKKYPLDTVYTVFRFNPRGTTYHYNGTSESNALNYKYYNEYASNDRSKNILSVTAALYERNNTLKVQNTITHADVVKYVKKDDYYHYAARWDGKEQGIPAIKTQGKRLYFTGRLVPATIYSINTTGTESRTIFTGAMSGNGDGPAAIYIHNRGKNDIYLENFQLATGSLIVEGDEPTSMFDKVPRKYLNAAITLEGNGQDTYIHFRGRNYLAGNSGKSTITTLYGAAVYMNVDATDYMSLIFDDYWVDGRQTSGLLKLEGSTDDRIGDTESTYHCTASPIYSGNKNTAVTFNGGIYHLSPADNTTSTNNFMIVSRRMYKTPLVDYVFPDVGSDVGDGLVYIKGGTFRMTTPLLSNPCNNAILLANSEQYDREYYVMYFPTRTYITGGSFENCLVRTTDGDASAPECTGLISCPTNGTDTVFAYNIPYSFDDRQPIFKYEPDAITDNYDFSSAIPTYNENTGEYYIVPYLPSRGDMECENTDENDIQYWDILFPSGVNADITNENRPLYATLKQAQGKNIQKTAYFGSCEINPYYPVERHTTPSNLTEGGEFRIDKRVYLITWTMADRWRVKTMPFDVSNVTLIHTWATDSLGNTADPDQQWDYYQKAVQTIILKGRLSELDSERGINMPFWSFYQRAIASKQPDPQKWVDAGNKYLPQVARQPIPLYYKGQNDTLKSSYYLFEAATEQMSDGRFCLSWKVPSPDENGIIMHKGRTYAFMFPNVAKYGENGYNYWDGKYIVLEGPGQTLSNAHKHAEIPTDNNIQIIGNSSFNVMRNAPDMRYDFDYNTQRFERYSYTSVGWSEPYIMSSATAWDNNQRFGLDCLLDQTVDALPIQTGDKSLTVIRQDNRIVISTSQAQEIGIYSATGQLIRLLNMPAGSTQSINLQSGLYLIYSSVTNETYKIICQ